MVTKTAIALAEIDAEATFHAEAEWRAVNAATLFDAWIVLPAFTRRDSVSFGIALYNEAQWCRWYADTLRHRPMALVMPDEVA